MQPAAVMAIWGRETAFGRATIPYYAVGALATLSFMGRRKRYFRREVLFALKILQDGHVTRAAMKSSWAGAMGHTQFLPSHFMNFAVDFDKDGKRDIWNSVPDALASAANYLSKRGWQRDTPWFYEVRLPRKFDCTLQGPKRIRTIAEWVRLGVKRTAKRKFPKHRLKTRGFLLLPAGVKGPAFIALKNFSVIKQYNLSDLYALFVGHLADRFTRDRGFVGRWPKLRNYSRAEVKRMQIGLNRLGHRSGRTDGIIGNLTRVSVGLYQKAAKRPLTCYPSRTDFDALVRAANR